jgi:hypothetical protein
MPKFKKDQIVFYQEKKAKITDRWKSDNQGNYRYEIRFIRGTGLSQEAWSVPEYRLSEGET